MQVFGDSQCLRVKDHSKTFIAKVRSVAKLLFVASWFSALQNDVQSKKWCGVKEENSNHDGHISI
jgi:hypothetical protein